MENPNLPKYITLLKELLSIPSVSALKDRQSDSILAAEFVEKLFREIDFETSFHFAKDHEKEPPVIVVKKVENPKNPTVLFYCHYDVQPADESGWINDPFEPLENNGHIYGRGAIDDKGPLITLFAALSELQKEWQNNWPINVICLFDGQEESGSNNLTELFKETSFQNFIQADTAIVIDGIFADDKTPTITYGFRGLVYFRVKVKRGDFSVHSGLYGGTILNPIHVLSDIISKIYDVKTGKILLPNFYENVEVPDAKERELLAQVPFSEKEFLATSGNTPEAFGEKEFTIKERTAIRPSFDVNGMWGGFTEEAVKTIIPAEATANLGFRIVPNQSVDEIKKIFSGFIDSLDYPGNHIEISFGYDAEPVKAALDSHWVDGIKNALQEVFGISPILDRIGGSGAEMSMIQNYLDIGPMVIGYARPQDNYHGVNEKISLDMFEKGIEANKLILKNFAKIKR